MLAPLMRSLIPASFPLIINPPPSAGEVMHVVKYAGRRESAQLADWIDRHDVQISRVIKDVFDAMPAPTPKPAPKAKPAAPVEDRVGPVSMTEAEILKNIKAIVSSTKGPNVTFTLSPDGEETAITCGMFGFRVKGRLVSQSGFISSKVVRGAGVTLDYMTDYASKSGAPPATTSGVWDWIWSKADDPADWPGVVMPPDSKRVAVAVADDQNRYGLNVGAWVAVGDIAVLAATDGNRLILRPVNSAPPRAVIFPPEMFQKSGVMHGKSRTSAGGFEGGASGGKSVMGHWVGYATSEFPNFQEILKGIKYTGSFVVTQRDLDIITTHLRKGTEPDKNNLYMEHRDGKCDVWFRPYISATASEPYKKITTLEPASQGESEVLAESFGIRRRGSSTGKGIGFGAALFGETANAVGPGVLLLNLAQKVGTDFSLSPAVYKSKDMLAVVMPVRLDGVKLAEQEDVIHEAEHVVINSGLPPVTPDPDIARLLSKMPAEAVDVWPVLHNAQAETWIVSRGVEVVRLAFYLVSSPVEVKIENVIAAVKLGSKVIRGGYPIASRAKYGVDEKGRSVKLPPEPPEFPASLRAGIAGMNRVWLRNDVDNKVYGYLSGDGYEKRIVGNMLTVNTGSMMARVPVKGAKDAKIALTERQMLALALDKHAPAHLAFKVNADKRYEYEHYWVSSGAYISHASEDERDMGELSYLMQDGPACFTDTAYCTSGDVLAVVTADQYRKWLSASVISASLTGGGIFVGDGKVDKKVSESAPVANADQVIASLKRLDRKSREGKPDLKTMIRGGKLYYDLKAMRDMFKSVLSFASDKTSVTLTACVREGLALLQVSVPGFCAIMAPTREHGDMDPVDAPTERENPRRNRQPLFRRSR